MQSWRGFNLRLEGLARKVLVVGMAAIRRLKLRFATTGIDIVTGEPRPAAVQRTQVLLLTEISHLYRVMLFLATFDHVLTCVRNLLDQFFICGASERNTLSPSREKRTDADEGEALQKATHLPRNAARKRASTGFE